MPTVLCLDDDRVFRRLVVDALEKRGYRVLQAGRASEADALLAQNEPDLILVDGLLPDITGIEWLEKQRSAGRNTPVLFVTSFWKRMRDYELVTQKLGRTELLRKPVLPEEVAARAEALLRGLTPG